MEKKKKEEVIDESVESLVLMSNGKSLFVLFAVSHVSH